MPRSPCSDPFGVVTDREQIAAANIAFFEQIEYGFLLAGLEARREFDMRESREHARLALPLVVGLGGMMVPVSIYLACNAGRASAGVWGAAMSTDTAFALGLLALVGPHGPDRCGPTC